MISIPNLLLVSGSGRNVGKTTFICNLINHISKSNDIVGIKITPHFHNSRENKRVIFENDNVFISEELDRDSTKDSSLMLLSGAATVYYIEVQNDDYQPIIKFLQKIPGDLPLICESASLRKFIDPGKFILIDNDAVNEKKPIFLHFKDKADIILNTNHLNIIDINILISYSAKWEIRV